MRRSSRSVLGVVLTSPVLLFSVTACVGSTAREGPGGNDPSGRVGSPTPGPVRTVIRGAQVVPVGDRVPLSAQAGVSLVLTAAGPDVSRDRLSSSYGYAPANGLYVTFRMTIANTGRRTITVSPRDFSVKVEGGGRRVSTYDGNAPYSGASRQLDETLLEPGDRVRAPLTFDVDARHGRLAYAPDGSPAIVWTF